MSFVAAERPTGQAFSHESETHRVYPNLTRDQLLQHAVINGEGKLLHNGPLVVNTEPYTNRQTEDNFFVVHEQSSDNDPALWFEGGAKPLDSYHARVLEEDVRDYLDRRPLYRQDLRVVADPRISRRVRLNTTDAAAAVFAENLFFRNGTSDRYDSRSPHYVVYHAPDFQVDPRRHGTRDGSTVAITQDFETGTVVIVGTRYFGQIKKAIFTELNSHLLLGGDLPFHGSISEGVDVSMFLALSGTGKTTLGSADGRVLVNDDEGVWRENGLVGCEDGSYAKAIRLKEEKEQKLYKGVHAHGTLLENVVERDGVLDLDDASITENTRAAIDLSDMDGVSPTRMTGHPNNIFMLSFDAHGVLPAVSQLTAEQAAYYFLTGYTSKVGKTVAGVDGIQSTFSAGFGQDFLPHHPIHYARRFMEKIAESRPDIWLINTGLNGTGKQMPLEVTRAIVEAAQKGLLSGVSSSRDDVLRLISPNFCPGVPPEYLDPSLTWDDREEFERRRITLARSMRQNAAGKFGGMVPQQILASGPLVV